MTMTPDDALRAALRRLRVPEAPDPEALLDRACPTPRVVRARTAAPWMAVAALALATVPLWAPAPDGSEAWTDGLVRRGTVFVLGVRQRLEGGGP